MDKRPRSEWTPQMVADFKEFYEQKYGKKKNDCPVRADVEFDIGV